MVGDDFQSIYGFRASSPRHILGFADVFPDARTVLLERNYRSTQEILDVANAVSAQDESGFPRRLWSDREGAVRPELVFPHDEGAQAREVCDRVLIAREQAIELRAQAVLFRTGHDSALLELELTRRGIPFVKYGGLRYLDAAHVKDLLALLRLVDNPADELAWFRVLQLLDGVGPARARRILQALRGGHVADGSPGAAAGTTAGGEHWEAASEQVPEGSRAHAASLFNALRRARSAPQPVAGTRVEGLCEALAPLVRLRYPDGAIRVGDLEPLAAAARTAPELRSFVAELAIDPPTSSAALAGRPHLDEDYLVLSTVHSAKGLEWEAVHVISAYDGNFPADMSTSSQEGVAEERRLFYVALTRARRRLHVYVPAIFHHRPHGADDAHGLGQASRYLSPEVQRLFTTSRPPACRGPGRGRGRSAGPGRPRRRCPLCGSGCPCRPCSRPDGTEVRWGGALHAAPGGARALRPGARGLRARGRRRHPQAGTSCGSRPPNAPVPLYVELNRAVWRSGGHVLSAYQPDEDAGANLQRDFFELAGEEQVDYFPSRYMRGLVDEMDHQVSVIATTDPRALDSVDPARIMRRGEAMRQLLDWRGEKENEGRFTWTLGLYGTEAMADEAGLDAEAYWEQIIHACFLDSDDPVARWREVGERLESTRERLDELQIASVHVTGPDVDLKVALGEDRRWLGGRGRNIPSFEIFTSPDWRGTEGWIHCDQPLYRYGNLVRGIRLKFEGGRVVEAGADENERVLKEMIATEGADRIGEFSLTDQRFSRITRFMAQTLYDENVGGSFGNTHIALGRAYQDAYDRRPRDARAGGLGAARVQQLERSHRRRLDDRADRHRHAAGRLRARHLQRRRVRTRLGAALRRAGAATASRCRCTAARGAPPCARAAPRGGLAGAPAADLEQVAHLERVLVRGRTARIRAGPRRRGPGRRRT